jgi:hypothetical protein
VRTVLLVELSAHHDEVLLSLAIDLRALGCRVAVACRADVAARIPGLDPALVFPLHADAPLWRRVGDLRQLRQWARAHKVTAVVFCTASGTRERDAILTLGIRPAVGVLHYVSKLGRSTTQRLIERRLDAYLVLGPQLARLARGRSSIPVHCVPAAARLAPPDAIGAGNGVPAPDEAPITIAVPGTIEPRRRGYGDLFSREVADRLPTTHRVLMLGRCDPANPEHAALRAAAARLGDRVTWSDRFVSHADMHRAVAGCAAVLPLLHPDCAEFPDFLADKISGSMSLAWAYRKPMVLHDALRGIPELHHGARWYGTATELGTVLGALRREPAVAYPWTERDRRAALSLALGTVVT